MKNKLFMAGIAVLSIFSLAACSNNKGEDYDTVRKDAPSQAVCDTFGLFIDKEADNPYANAVKLDAETEKSGSYYDIYISSDAVSSLFVYNWDMSTYFEEQGENNRSASVTSYVFKDCLYDEEKTAILSQAYNKEKGLSTSVTTDFTMDTTQSMDKSINTSIAYQAYKDGNTVSLSVVYMPVYVVHYVSDKAKLQMYVFLPVYLTFTTGDKEVVADGKGYKLEDSTISKVTKTIDLVNYVESTGVLKYE